MDCLGSHSFFPLSTIAKDGSIQWNHHVLHHQRAVDVCQRGGFQAQGKDWSSAQFLFDPTDAAYVKDHWIYLDHDQAVSGSLGASYLWKELNGSTRVYVDAIYGSGLRTDATSGGQTIPNGGTVPAYYSLNVGVEQAFKVGKSRSLKARLDIVNVTDNVYELRNGSGAFGVNAAQYGERRGIFDRLAMRSKKDTKVGYGIANETSQLVVAVTSRPTNLMAHIGFEPNDNTPLVPVLTFVGWVVCLAIGLLGFLMPYSRPLRSVKAPQSVKVERLIVELSKEPRLPQKRTTAGQPFIFHRIASGRHGSATDGVAEPSAAIAFAAPGGRASTRVVPFDQATYAKPSSTTATAVQTLTFGQGEGRSPRRSIPRKPFSSIRKARW